MAIVLDNVRLPEEVEVGSHGGPMFQTTVVGLASGGEQRNQDWSEARQEWDISYGIDNPTNYNAVRDFFFARRGRARGFLFKDWSDYVLDDELIGTGDGSETEFQIIKTYEGSGPHSYGRRITRPDATTLVVRVDGVVKTIVTDYTVTLGLITFTSPPANAKLIRVDCEFDIPMRFDSDKFDLSLEATIAGAVQSLTIVELRE